MSSKRSGCSSSQVRVAYPRSAAVAAALTPREYDFLACAADVSDEARAARRAVMPVGGALRVVHCEWSA